MRFALSAALLLAPLCLPAAADAQEASLFFSRERLLALCESSPVVKSRESAFLFLDGTQLTVDDGGEPGASSSIAGLDLPFQVELIRKAVAARKERAAGTAVLEAADDERPIEVIFTALLKLDGDGVPKKARGSLLFVDDEQACISQLDFIARRRTAPEPPGPGPIEPPGPIDPPGPPF
jgi:hypothetical protein